MGRGEEEGMTNPQGTSMPCGCDEGRNHTCERHIIDGLEAQIAQLQRQRPLSPMGDDLMQEAWDLSNGDRHASYGSAEDAFRAYGHIWTGLLTRKLRPGVVITPEDVALLMTGLKLARDSANGKRDNIVDAHGYLSLLARLRGWIGK